MYFARPSIYMLENVYSVASKGHWMSLFLRAVYTLERWTHTHRTGNDVFGRHDFPYLGGGIGGSKVGDGKEALLCMPFLDYKRLQVSFRKYFVSTVHKM